MFEALFLGLLQGLTEFLPISSSAHLRLAGEFLPGAGDPGATFTAITQIGTELAVLIYFRKDIARIAAAWLSKVVIRKEIPGISSQDVRLGWMIILGSLPIVVLGYLFQENIRNTFRSLWLIAIFGACTWSFTLWSDDCYGASPWIYPRERAAIFIFIGCAGRLWQWIV